MAERKRITNGTGTCCVFQPFDKGTYDKRFEDIFEPAIRETGLDAYRVDKDEKATIPVESLHEHIRLSRLCFADITVRNPNVMYELGYAIASGKDVVIVSAPNEETKYPFNIQHRGIIEYSVDSSSDFDRLRKQITNKIVALLDKQETTLAVSSDSPVQASHGLAQNEIAALALLLANQEGRSGTPLSTMKLDMEKAGFTRAATQLALLRLERLAFVEQFEDSDWNGNSHWVAYRLAGKGEDWLLGNRDQVVMRTPPPGSAPEDELSDDSPF